MTGNLIKAAGTFAQGMGRNRSQDDEPKHRAPEERKRGIAQYSADAYPQGAPLRDEQTTWLQAVRRGPEYAQAKVTVAAVYQAMKARAGGDYPGAKAAIARARTTSFGAAPVVINEDARLRDDMGDGDGSDRLFRQAHLSPDQSVQGYIDHVRMLWRRGETRPAGDIIRAGVQRFDNDDKPFISLQIAVARQAGRDSEVDALLRRCSDYGDDALQRDCNLAAGRSADQHADAPKVSMPKSAVQHPGPAPLDTKKAGASLGNERQQLGEQLFLGVHAELGVGALDVGAHGEQRRAQVVGDVGGAPPLHQAAHDQLFGVGQAEGAGEIGKRDLAPFAPHRGAEPHHGAVEGAHAHDQPAVGFGMVEQVSRRRARGGAVEQGGKLVLVAARGAREIAVAQHYGPLGGQRLLHSA